MSLRHFHFFDCKTGLLHGNVFATDSSEGADALARANAPEGHGVIEGTFDHLTQRVDVSVAEATQTAIAAARAELKKLPIDQRRVKQAEIDALRAKLIVDYQPPQPSTESRVERHDEALAALCSRAGAPGSAKCRPRIAAPELSQARALREHALGNAEGTKRLQAIEEEIARLRSQLV